MHGAVLLDSAGAVLRPAILWNDQRTADACDEIRRAVGPERLIEITGNDALTGFTAPKLVWVRDQEPEVWARVRARAAAQGLRSVPADRRVRASTRRTARGRCCSISLRGTGRPRCSRRSGSIRRGCRRRFEGPAVTGVVSAAAATATGIACRHAGRRRGRRSGGERRRCRRDRAGGRGAVARDVRASCSRRPRRRCATRPARSTRSATRCPAGGT